MKSLEEVFKSNLMRLRGGRTQAEIAEKAGIPLRSYQNVEANGAIPQGPNRRAIAKALGVPETHLFIDTEEFSPKTGISPSEAWEIVGKALQTPPPSPPPPDDPRILELVERLRKNPFAINAALTAARGRPGQDKPKKDPTP